MSAIELFLQREGVPDVILLEIDSDATVADLIATVERAHPLGADGETCLSREDEDEPLAPSAKLGLVGVGNHTHIHVHRARRVEVAVTFNGQQKTKVFPLAATVRRVKNWSVGPDGFGLDPEAGASHVLQISGTNERPKESTHLGALLKKGEKRLAFDLVPKRRVEG